MVASALKWNGAFVWACKNYDGDVTVRYRCSGFWLSGFDDLNVGDAGRQNHGSRSRPRQQLPAITGCINKVSQPQPTRLPLSSPGPVVWRFRGKLDGNAELIKFCETLEKACVDTVEAGQMTKDLALCIYGEN